MVTESYFKSVCRLIASPPAGVEILVHTMPGESLIPRARNLLAHHFLQSDCTHLLFVDSDIMFEPQNFSRLLGCGKDLCGCVYPKKMLYWERMKKVEGPDKQSPMLDFACNLDPRYANAAGSIDTDNGFARALDMGCGFMLIGRKVFDAIREANPDLLQREGDQEYFGYFNLMIDPETRWSFSEDYSFCRRWIKSGGEVWVDMMSRLGHYGGHLFVGSPVSEWGSAS